MTPSPARRTRSLPIPARMHPWTQAPRNLPADELVVAPLAVEVGAVLLLVARAAKAAPVVLAMRAQTRKTRTTKTKKTRKRRKTKTLAAQEAALRTQRVERVEPLATRRRAWAEALPTTTTLAFRTLKDLTS
jgi:hypothetical protein